MKRIVLGMVLVLAAAVALPAQAVICTVDNVPAATLLLPYFEVDLDDENGINTLFSINNASATAALAHVVVWTDLSVPVLDFNVYLTGYDVQTISLRDIIVNGQLPVTASDGQDPTDTISNQGLFSQDINFASCTGQLPYSGLPANFVAHLQSILTGGPSALSSFAGNCGGRNLGDGIARGYVTVDTVNNCSLDFPGDPGYFGPGGTGTATNQNILWGDYFYVDSGENFAQGETLVHVEADALNPETSVPGEYTFYGRYVAWSAIDNREPLSSNFVSRYITGGPFSGGTDLVVWRDGKIPSSTSGYSCGSIAAGTNPPWFPLAQEQIVIFDEEENPVVEEGCTVSPCEDGDLLVPFPAEAQRTTVGGIDLPSPFPFGFLWLNLNSVVVGQLPNEDPAAMQNWVTTIMNAEGRYSVGFDAISIDSTCNASHALIGGGF
ncbi:MAG TPA: hypothetical protein VHM02_15845 [Thermoanaerobaculia bacterium]|nr:hypothetical protein [Thermoanaerobaculia bacterium]